VTTGAHLPAARPPRVWFVDVVRLLASLQMVNGHTIDAVLLPSIEQGPIFDTYNWGRGLVSVCFLMVAGMAFHLSSLARYEHHRRNPAAIRRRFRRALVVIAGGYFLGFPWAATSPDPAQAQLAWTYFFSVGILHSIGLALIMLELLVLASQSARQVVGAAAALAVLAFALAPAADATLARGTIHPLLNWARRRRHDDRDVRQRRLLRVYVQGRAALRHRRHVRVRVADDDLMLTDQADRGSRRTAGVHRQP
jgi:hypothetical protein